MVRFHDQPLWHPGSEFIGALVFKSAEVPLQSVLGCGPRLFSNKQRPIPTDGQNFEGNIIKTSKCHLSLEYGFGIDVFG